MITIARILIIISILGIIKNKNNNILLLLCLELFFIGLSLLFLNSSLNLDDFEGVITSIIILCVSATESAIGLTMILANSRNK